MINRLLTVLVVMLLAAAGAAADEPVGSVAYLEGQPGIVRGGRPITDTVDFGFSLYNLDHIRTDQSSVIEFSLLAHTGMEGRVTVQPESEFYLAFDQGRRESTVHLLRGSSSFSVDRIPRGRSFSVRTSGAVMGVRGTDFTIDTAGQGEYLVTTGSGRVEVRAEDGATAMAVPGQAVEFTVVNGFRAVALAAGQEHDFRTRWREQRLEALRANPEAAVADFSRRYRAARDEFLQRYEELMTHEDIIDRWILEDRQGRQSSTMEQMQQKSAVAGPLMRMAAHMVIFERLYYRTAELRHQLDLADFQESDPREFFTEFDRDAAVLQERLDMLRYVFRLYAERNNGRLPF
ncbi:FecR family protein [Spirochaeta africana]|nr:FecR family protein [Spirochaeta africana]